MAQSMKPTTLNQQKANVEGACLVLKAVPLQIGITKLLGGTNAKLPPCRLLKLVQASSGRLHQQQSCGGASRQRTLSSRSRRVPPSVGAAAYSPCGTEAVKPPGRSLQRYATALSPWCWHQLLHGG